MPKISSTGSTMKQAAYARRVFGAKGKQKKYIALDVGYSESTSNTVACKIEATKGFHNAMAKLAVESNNMALEVMSEFKARGLKEFSNMELIGALNAISSAWQRFNGPLMKDDGNQKDTGGNKLRTIVMQRIENQTVNTNQPETFTAAPQTIEMEEQSAPLEEDPGF